MGISEMTDVMLRFFTAGSVDDGKSTLVGRLLHDTRSIAADQLDALARASRFRGSDKLDLALLTDGLKEERERGITIDIAYRYFSTRERKFIVIDTPGHLEYLPKMMTGASHAQAGLLIVDAENGITDQTRRHAFIAATLGISRLILCVNKMDLVGYAEDVFARISADFKKMMARFEETRLDFIPISALTGENVVHESPRMPWHLGPTLLRLLETLDVADEADSLPLRIVLQMKLDGGLFAARVVQGTLAVGDELLALPSGKRTIVTDIRLGERRFQQVGAGQSIALGLSEPSPIPRIDTLVSAKQPFPVVDRQARALIFWLDAAPWAGSRAPLLVAQPSRTCPSFISEVFRMTDLATWETLPGEGLSSGRCAHATLACAHDVVRDSGEGFTLVDPALKKTVAAGLFT